MPIANAAFFYADYSRVARLALINLMVGVINMNLHVTNVYLIVPVTSAMTNAMKACYDAGRCKLHRSKNMPKHEILGLQGVCASHV